MCKQIVKTQPLLALPNDKPTLTKKAKWGLLISLRHEINRSNDFFHKYRYFLGQIDTI